ncbi:hypothetical protein GGF32_009314 [Allomyces javanicus]|nr:hypothetical protein GGF32_009314 [Allomyces javanicus]
MFAALLRQDSALDSPAKNAAAAKPPPAPAARRRASAADLRASSGGGAASPVPTTPAGSPYSVPPMMMMMPPSPSPYSHYPAYVPSPLHSSAASVTSSASSSSTASSSASSAPSVGAMAALAAPPMHHQPAPQAASRSSPAPATATPSETPTGASTRWSSWTSLAAWNPFPGGTAPAAPNLATARAPTAAPPTAASATAPMPAATPAWAATTPMHPLGHGAATPPVPPTPVIYAYPPPPHDVQHHLATAPPPPGTPVLMPVLMNVPAGAPGSPPAPQVPFSYYAPAGYPAGYATPTTAPGTPSAAAAPHADLMARVAAAAAAASAGQPSMPTGLLPTNYLLSIASVTVAFLQPFVHYANRHQDARRAHAVQAARSGAATPVGVMAPTGALATTPSASPPTVPARGRTTPAPVLVSSIVVAAVLAVFLVPAVLTAITVSWTRFGRQHVLRELREAALVAHVRWATGEMRPIAMPMAHALQLCAAIIDRAPYLVLPANRRFLAALISGRPAVRARLRPAQQLLASGMLKSRAATAAVAEALGVWVRWVLLTIVSLMAVSSDTAVPVPVPVPAGSARVAAPAAGDAEVEGSSTTTARRSPGSPRKRRSMVRS